MNFFTSNNYSIEIDNTFDNGKIWIADCFLGSFDIIISDNL